MLNDHLRRGPQSSWREQRVLEHRREATLSFIMHHSLTLQPSLPPSAVHHPLPTLCLGELFTVSALKSPPSLTVIQSPSIQKQIHLRPQSNITMNNANIPSFHASIVNTFVLLLLKYSAISPSSVRCTSWDWNEMLSWQHPHIIEMICRHKTHIYSLFGANSMPGCDELPCQLDDFASQ